MQLYVIEITVPEVGCFWVCSTTAELLHIFNRHARICPSLSILHSKFLRCFQLSSV